MCVTREIKIQNLKFVFEKQTISLETIAVLIIKYRINRVLALIDFFYADFCRIFLLFAPICILAQHGKLVAIYIANIQR